MGLKERTTVVISEQDITVTDTPLILNSDRLIEAPRGAVTRIAQVSVDVTMRPNLTTSQRLHFSIMKNLDTFPTGSVLATRFWRRQQPLAMGHMGVSFEAGATDTSNVVSIASKYSQIITPPSPDHKSWQQRVTGAGSNTVSGWIFRAWAQSGGTTIFDYTIIAEVEIEWIDTSRSRRATWTMDQMVEEECC